ncbi:MAG: hypothetical protein U0169_19740 [Polyangiaceae bacterium]
MNTSILPRVPRCALVAVALLCLHCSGEDSSPEGTDRPPPALPEPGDAAAHDGAEEGSSLDVDAGAASSSTSADVESPEAGPEAFLLRKRVFVTSRQYEGNLVAAGGGADGLESADRLCTSAAQSVGIYATWKAFLSGRVGGTIFTPRSRFTFRGPWYAMDRGTLAFRSLSGLQQSPVTLATIQTTESGSPVARDPLVEWVWTGTERGWFRGNNCAADDGGDSWRSSSRSVRGTAGNLVDSKTWSTTGAFYDPSCDARARLYCFEQ